MNAADIELAKMIYLASSLGVVLFTSMILRGLWRPLRFVLLACTLSILYTPYFIKQKMPDGSDQNMIPAYVMMGHKIAEDREHWREIAITSSKPIVVVAGISSTVALLLALILPKPKKKVPVKKPVTTEENESNQPKNNTHKHKKHKKKKRSKNTNPYLPEDFQAAHEKITP